MLVLIRRFPPVLWLSLLLCLFAALLYGVVHFAPKAVYMGWLKVDKIASIPLVLGHQALGQVSGYNAADRQHLQLNYDAGKATWQFTNVSANKKVLAYRKEGGGQESFYLKRWRLSVGDIVQINRTRLEVMRLSTEGLVLQDLSSGVLAHWVHQQAKLQLEDVTNFVGCPNTGMGNAFLHVWHNWRGKPYVLFTLGGQVACDNRWKLAGIPTQSAAVIFDQGAYWLRPLRADVFYTFQAVGAEVKKLDELRTAVTSEAGDIQQIIVGKTHYSVSPDQESLVLSAKRGMHLFTSPPQLESDNTLHDSQQIKTHWREASWVGTIAVFSPVGWFVFALLAMLLLIAFYLSWLLSQWWRVLRVEHSPFFYWLCLLIPIISFVVAWRVFGDHLQNLLILIFVSWTWLVLLLWRNDYLQGTFGYVWLILLFLIFTGLLTLTQLAAGAENTRWLKYPVAYAQFLLAAAIPLSFFALSPPLALCRIWEAMVLAKGGFIRVVYLVAVSLLVFMLALQWGQDTEGGLGFLQPVEFVKLLLVILLARLALNMNEVRLLNAREYRQAKMKWIGSLLLSLLGALAVVMLVTLGVADFSPLLIVFVLLLAYFWIIVRHPVSPRWQSLWKARSVVLVILAVVFLSAGYFYHYPEMATWLPQADRIMIWSDPWAYPDTGRQLQLSLSAVGSSGWLGINGFGSNAAIMNIPAVQDDFILAFFLFKFGGLAGLLLLAVQCAWLNVQFYLVQQLLKQEPYARNERLAQSMLAYVLYGLLWMQLLHWLISWGNVLGFMPIMGQPMTWLSSGNSHLLAVALPSVLLSFIAWGFLSEAKARVTR